MQLVNKCIMYFPLYFKSILKRLLYCLILYAVTASLYIWRIDLCTACDKHSKSAVQHPRFFITWLRGSAVSPVTGTMPEVDKQLRQSEQILNQFHATKCRTLQQQELDSLWNRQKGYFITCLYSSLP